VTLTWRNRALTLASACIALSLLFSARAFLSESSLTIFELPLVMSGSILFAWAAWAADARMDRTWTTWLLITGTAAGAADIAHRSRHTEFGGGDLEGGPKRRIILTLAAFRGKEQVLHRFTGGC
jgi:hypothetical protein